MVRAYQSIGIHIVERRVVSFALSRMTRSPPPQSQPQSPPQPTLRHFEQLTAQLMDGVILLDPAGTILSANAAALRMHGVTTLDALGGTTDGYAARFSVRTATNQPLKHRDYPLARLLAGESFPDLTVGVAPANEEQIRWIHQVRDVVMDVDGGEPDYLALVISDVSARFDAEARFAAMFGANPAPAIIVRLADQRISQANPGFVALSGFAADELVGTSLLGRDLLGDMPDAASVRRAIERGDIIAQTDAKLLTADGTRRLVLFAGQPIDVTGEDGLLLTFADLEPRRQAEQALLASQRHLAAMFDMAPVAMMMTDERAQVTATNAAFRHLTRLADDRLVGRAVAGVHRWETPAAGEAVTQRLAERGSAREVEVALIGEADVAIPCVAAVERVDVDGTPHLLWVYQDVTDRRRNEQELAAAIEEVMKDASWLSRSILDKLAALRRPEVRTVAVELSPREREIVHLICDDLGDAAIAERLGLSRNTVRNHVARIYAKIGVNRRSGAVVWGRERGMGTRQPSGL